MKRPYALLNLAAFLSIYFQFSCADHPAVVQTSYESVQWPTLMRGYSDLDNALGDFLPQKNAVKDFTHSSSLLRDLKMPDSLIDKMTLILLTTDTELNRPAYHGFVHSARVGNVTSTVMNSQAANALTDDQKLLLTLAALFHDVDPDRVKGLPPKVSSTFVWMDNDQRAKDFFTALETALGITKKQIQTVIKYTDFDVDPAKLKTIKDDADQMADRNFDAANASVVKLWGPRIAFIDQVAMYIGSYHFAVQAVVGLANEFRALSQYAANAKGSIHEKITKPSDVDILSNTAKFLEPRIKEEHMKILPISMQENLKNVHKTFDTNWTGQASIN